VVRKVHLVLKVLDLPVLKVLKVLLVLAIPEHLVLQDHQAQAVLKVILDLELL
jgi:hypothetical protein